MLPTAVLLVGALFAEQHVAAAGIATAQLPTSTGCHDGLAAKMDWLAGQLEQRGAAVMRLPLETDGMPRREQLLVHLAGTLSRCCVLGAPQNGCSDDAHATLRLGTGAEARLLQHMRLNQLLPWFAAEGLVVASLLAATCEHGQRGVPTAALLEAAAWLRHVLAPEIDTAVGPDALGSADDFKPALQRLLDTNALHQQPAPSRCVRLAVAGEADDGCRQGALFAACVLAPLVATYVEVLRATQAALAGGGSVTSKAVCTTAQQHLLALANEPRGSSNSGDDLGNGGRGGSSRAAQIVIPSAALVQGALKSLASAGVLAAAPANSSTDEAYRANVAVPRNGSSSRHSPVAPRRSFERRRPRRPSSGSESEEGPLADSVAANLCLLSSNDSAARSGDSASLPAELQAAAVGETANSWVLARPEALSALMSRLATFACV